MQPALPTLLIIGANGGIGLATVQQALASEHYKVIAIVRNPAKLPLTHPHLLIAKGDVLQPATYAAHLPGVAAVISALGVRHREPTTLYSRGNAILLEQMQRAGVRRIFCISASGLDVNPTHPFLVRWFTKNVLQKILRNMYADLRRMEALIQHSSLDWTLVRPPRLTDKAATGQYRVSIDQPLPACYSIARADVAHFMLNGISNQDLFKKRVEIGY
jgi:putative NADH-flavin reductase